MCITIFAGNKILKIALIGQFFGKNDKVDGAPKSKRLRWLSNATKKPRLNLFAVKKNQQFGERSKVNRLQ